MSIMYVRCVSVLGHIQVPDAKERASAPGGCWKLRSIRLHQARRPTMTEAYDGRQVVGMDLHRRRSVLVRMTGDGRKLETVRIENSPRALRAVLVRAGKNPRGVGEATYGWDWAVDVLEEAGAEVHLAHPLGVKAFTYRGSRTMSATPRTWPACCGWAGCRRRGVAPPEIRELRELTRYRHKLVGLRTSCRD